MVCLLLSLTADHFGPIAARQDSRSSLCSLERLEQSPDLSVPTLQMQNQRSKVVGELLYKNSIGELTLGLSAVDSAQLTSRRTHYRLREEGVQK